MKNALTVLIENRKHHIDHVIGQLHMGHRFGHMLERRLINGRTSNVIECQRCVHIVNVVEKVEKVQILLVRNTASGFLEILLDPLQFLCLFLVRIASIRQHQFGKIGFGNVAIGIRILALELERQDFALQLMLEFEKFLNSQFLVLLLAKEERVQCRIYALHRNMNSI